MNRAVVPRGERENGNEAMAQGLALLGDKEAQYLMLCFSFYSSRTVFELRKAWIGLHPRRLV
jgi:hypothetical protein